MPFGILNGMKMKLSIDKAGRMVLPLAVRKQFGLRAGAELELTIGMGTILLHPVEQEVSMRVENGLCVHEGIPEGEILNAVEMCRESRAYASWGGQDEHLL